MVEHRLNYPSESLSAPEVRYARSGAVSIAYQVVGDGPVDLLYIPGWKRTPGVDPHPDSDRSCLERSSSLAGSG
jgi:hypothetical protein